MKGIIAGKIKKLAALTKIASRLKKTGKTIVLCHGDFDLVHPGHIRFFESAKKSGDILVVSLVADKYIDKGPGRPIFHQQLRAEFLGAIEFIDYIIITNSFTSVSVIEAIRPDILMRGSDAKEIISETTTVFDAENKAIEKIGGKVNYTNDKVIYSSTKIIGDYLDVYPLKTKAYLEKLKHKYPLEQILEKLKILEKIKVLIIGDTIIDQYYYCLPLGKSSKEPVMVHQYINEESFAGGVLATSNHAESLSKNITMVTLLGKKHSFKRFILKKMRAAVKPIFFFQPGESTIIKRRFVDLNNKQKLFQISYLKDDFRLSEKQEKEIVLYLQDQIPKFDMVIVNDFGHGLFTDKIVRLIAKKAKYLALNVQANSANYGFNVITKYPRADYVCIDNQEIRLATHDKFSDLKILIKKIYKKMKCSAMMVTRGPNGTMYFSQTTGYIEAPALSDKIVDRVGAGDALFAITAPCAYAGLPGELVSFMGNVAGALKVQIVGNKKQIETGDLVKFITRVMR